MANDALDDQDWEKRVVVRLPDVTVGGRLDQPKRARMVADASASKQKNAKSVWILAAFYGLLGVAIAEIAYIGKVGFGLHRNQSSVSNDDSNEIAVIDSSISHHSSVPMTHANSAKHQVFRDPVIGNKFRDALLTSQQNRTQQNQSSESKESQNVASKPNRVFH